MDSWYSKLSKSGWLGTMPKVTQELDSRKSWRDYSPESTPDMVGEAIKRAKQRATSSRKSEDDSDG